MANKMHEVEIRIAGFTYEREIPDPTDSSRTSLIHDFAVKGQTVEVNDRDYKSGSEIHAFVTDEDRQEAEASAAGTPEFNVADMDDEELQEWLVEDHPNVDETVAASQGDSELAQRILEAENAVTDNDPRQGVVDGLSKVIGEE